MNIIIGTLSMLVLCVLGIGGALHWAEASKNEDAILTFLLFASSHSVAIYLGSVL